MMYPETHYELSKARIARLQQVAERHRMIDAAMADKAIDERPRRAWRRLLRRMITFPGRMRSENPPCHAGD